MTEVGKITILGVVALCISGGLFFGISLREAFLSLDAINVVRNDNIEHAYKTGCLDMGHTVCDSAGFCIDYKKMCKDKTKQYMYELRSFTGEGQ